MAAKTLVKLSGVLKKLIQQKITLVASAGPGFLKLVSEQALGQIGQVNLGEASTNTNTFTAMMSMKFPTD